MLPTTQRPVGVALALLLCVAMPVAARAEDPQRAQALFAEAKALHDAGDDRAALDKLNAAYEAFPADGILISIANRHLDLGEPEEARDVLGRVAPTGKLRRPVTELQEKIDEALARPLQVQIAADAEGARVAIDGTPSRKLPLTVELSRGDHQFIFEAPGREALVLDRLLKGVGPVRVDAKLPVPVGRWQLALEPPGPLGDVRIVFDGAQVSLEAAERMGVATSEREARPGNYKVNCLRGIDEMATTTVVVRSGKLTMAVCRFRQTVSDSGGNEILGWASAGGAAVGLALGTYFLVSYLDDVDTYKEPRYEVSSTKPLGAGLMYTGAVGLGVLSYLSFTGSI